jgi:hypothetical protein
MKKQKIKCWIPFDITELCGPIENVIDKLIKYKDLADDVFFDIHYDYGNTEINLGYTREETDKEYEARIKKEEVDYQRKIETIKKQKEKLIKDAKKLGLKVTE